MTRCQSNATLYMPPPPQSSSRRLLHDAWLASKSGDPELEAQAAKLAKDARRRRVELRRIRSFSQAMSADDEGASTDFEGGRPRKRRSYGKISVVGRRREMNDVLAVELGFLKRGEETYDLFGVFDGREGWRAARACSQVLHRIFSDQEESKNEIDWEEVMLEGFDEVEARINKNGSAAAGTIAVVGDKEVVVAAKCEGSKAVLCSGGVAVRLLGDSKAASSDHESHSRMHNVNREQEQVQVGVTRRMRGDEFLILGSFGFWDVVSDEVACQIASGAGEGSGGAEAAAAAMAKVAMAQGSRDNISVILVDLRASDDGSSLLV